VLNRGLRFRPYYSIDKYWSWYPEVSLSSSKSTQFSCAHCYHYSICDSNRNKICAYRLSRNTTTDNAYSGTIAECIQSVPVSKSGAASSNQAPETFAQSGTTTQMHCTFLPVSLDNLKLKYQAVSYFWGDPTPAHLLECAGGAYIPITGTAASILRHIIELQEIGYFWIEALCIDQRNTAEGEQHFLLMGKVFATAKDVIAWLGDPSEDSDEAIQFVSILYSAMPKLFNAGKSIIEESLTGSPLCEYPSSRWTALTNIINRPWFDRVWIIQETVVASNVTVTCGRSSIEWNKLAMVIHIITRYGLRVLIKCNLEGFLTFSVGYERIQHMEEMRKKFQAGEPISCKTLFFVANCLEPRINATRSLL
jgi:hypothetical protein